MIIYLPDIFSDKTAETVKVLTEVYQFEIRSVFHHLDADLADEQIDCLIKETLLEDPEILMVGEKLGGHWANFFAEKYDLTCVLINPYLFPQDSLGKQFDFAVMAGLGLIEIGIEGYEKYPTSNSKYNSKFILLNPRDAHLSSDEILGSLKGHKFGVVTEESGQLISQAALIKAIDEALNYFCEPYLDD